MPIDLYRSVISMCCAPSFPNADICLHISATTVAKTEHSLRMVSRKSPRYCSVVCLRQFVPLHQRVLKSSLRVILSRPLDRCPNCLAFTRFPDEMLAKPIVYTCINVDKSTISCQLFSIHHYYMNTYVNFIFYVLCYMTLCFHFRQSLILTSIL